VTQVSYQGHLKVNLRSWQGYFSVTSGYLKVISRSFKGLLNVIQRSCQLLSGSFRLGYVRSGQVRLGLLKSVLAS
jgi:hypothetical protein